MTAETRDGLRVVSLGIVPDPATLYVFSAHERSYHGLSSDGTYLHSIRPARIDDPSVADGTTQVGELLCSCAGGRYGKQCYWTKLAIALERGDRGFVMDPLPADEPAWLAGGSVR